MYQFELHRNGLHQNGKHGETIQAFFNKSSFAGHQNRSSIEGEKWFFEAITATIAYLILH